MEAPSVLLSVIMITNGDLFMCCISGDQLLYLNGLSFKGKTVEEATTMFKNIRQGPVRVTAVRKVSQKVKVL